MMQPSLAYCRGQRAAQLGKTGKVWILKGSCISRVEDRLYRTSGSLLFNSSSVFVPETDRWDH